MSDLSETALSLIVSPPEASGGDGALPFEDESVSTQGRVGDDRSWPMPPFPAYAAHEGLAAQEACEVILLSGEVLRGWLSGLDVSDDLARVVQPPERVAIPVRFAHMASVSLSRPLSPLHETGSPAAGGEGAEDARSLMLRHWPRQPYHFVLTNGAELCGQTIGHVEGASGWFLFPPVDGSEDGRVTRLFVPRVSVRTSSIGERLGQMLIEDHQVEPDRVEEVVRKQQAMREQRLGESLLAMQVVTIDQLLAALDKQARMPMMRLGEALVALGHLSQSQLDEALKQQRRDRALPLGELLRKHHLVSVEQVRSAMARKMGYPVVDVQNFPLEPEALGTLPVEAARRWQVLPLMRRGERLVVAMVDPSRKLVVAGLERLSGCSIAPVLAGEADLSRRIEAAYAHANARPADPPALTTSVMGSSVRRVQEALEEAVRSFTGRADDKRDADAVPTLMDVADLAAPTSLMDIQSDAYPTVTGEFVPTDADAAALPVRLPERRPLAALQEVPSKKEAARESRRRTESSPPSKGAATGAAPSASGASASEAGALRRESPLLQTLGDLLQEAQQRGARSVHIEQVTDGDKLRVRLRVDGRMQALRDLPITYRTALPARIKALAELDVTDTRRAQHGRMPVGRIWPGLKLELDVSILPVGGGLEDVVLSVPARLKAMPLENLGLSPGVLDRVKLNIDRAAGLWLSAGPSRSGRTTTLHALLDHLQRDDRVIFALEPLAALTHDGVRRIEVSGRTPGDQAQAIRAAVHAGADVIMVSEFHSKDGIDAALRAVQDGCLVLGAVHARNGAEGVSRMLDLGADPWQLSDALLAVHAQRLAKRLCNSCRMSRPARDQEIATWSDNWMQGMSSADVKDERGRLLEGWFQRFGRDGRLRRYHSPGCERCGSTGVRGRRALHELMVIDRDLRRLIRAGAPAWNLQRQAMSAGMHSLRQDAIETMLAGWISSDEVDLVVDD